MRVFVFLLISISAVAFSNAEISFYTQPRSSLRPIFQNRIDRVSEQNIRDVLVREDCTNTNLRKSGFNIIGEAVCSDAIIITGHIIHLSGVMAFSPPVMSIMVRNHSSGSVKHYDYKGKDLIRALDTGVTIVGH